MLASFPGTNLYYKRHTRIVRMGIGAGNTMFDTATRS